MRGYSSLFVECAGSRSVGKPSKRWIDTVKKRRFGCQASKENGPG